MFCLFVCAFLLSVTTDGVQSRYTKFTTTRPPISQHKQVATWEEAKLRCQNEGAVLASPTDAELLRYMLSVISVNNHTTPYFIGIKSRHGAGSQFVSEEGVVLEDIPEALDLVEQLDSRNGDCLCMDGHSIRVVPCWTRLPYMCYSNVTEEATTTETPITTPTTCNSGYKLDDRTRSYYKLYVEELAASWQDAELTCNAEGGYLAVINNSLEARIASYHAFPVGNNNYPFAWIGLRDTTGNGDYQSVNGDKLKNIYSVFKERRGKYDCVVMRFDMKLEPWPCSDKLPFLCEKTALNDC